MFRDAPMRLLSEEGLEAVHGEAMRLLEEVGVEIRHEAALGLFRAAGQRVEGTRVRLDRAFVLETAARAPSSFTLHGRRPGRAVVLGGAGPVLTPVGGSPFVSDLERGRRDGTAEAHAELARMSHAADALSVLQSGMCEAQDLPETTRHLDMDYACLRWSDKPFICYGTSGPKARDAVELAAIVHGGRDAIAQRPVLLGIVNPNSPLVWDGLMADALMAWAEAGQGVAVTPFLLAGASAPVSVAAGLALLVAEALSGVALAQLVRPGTPCLFGSFYSGVDMRSGGPSFGTPESVLGALAGGQLARRYGLPFRGGGGLCSANALDAQAAAETVMSLWATYLGGADLVVHAAGWLEAGLTASYEKLALDLELLRMFARLGEGVGLDAEHFAHDTIAEEGPGAMFLASAHTLAHFHDWVFMSKLFRSQAYVTWERQGAPTPAQLAFGLWRELLESYEDPGLDAAIDEELQEHMARRRREEVAA